jgi:flagellar motor protein MotB
VSRGGKKRYVAPRMARYAFEDPMAAAQVRSVGGWKALLGFAVAFAGLGFAGYVYLIPYQKMQHAVGSRQAEIAGARNAAESATTERDKLKADLERYTSADKEKEAAESKRRAASDALALALKTGLEELGATVTPDGAKLAVSFPVPKVIDANGIDVSDAGQAAIKILAGAAKKEDAKVRVVARTSSAPPPKELRSLFHTAGEMRTVRAARVMSALEDAGLPPAQVSIIGEGDKPAARGRGKKAAAAQSGDRLELQVEPE